MAKKPEGMNYSIEHLKLRHYKDHGLCSVDAIKDDNVKEIMKEIFSHKKYLIQMNDEHNYVSDYLGNYIIFKPDHVIYNEEVDTYSILFSPYDGHCMNGMVLQLDDILYSNFDSNLVILDDAETMKTDNDSTEYKIRDYSEIFSLDTIENDKVRNLVEEIMSHKSYYIVKPTLNGFYKGAATDKLIRWTPYCYRTINGRTTITFRSETCSMTLDVDEIPLRVLKVKD